MSQIEILFKKNLTQRAYCVTIIIISTFVDTQNNRLIHG